MAKRKGKFTANAGARQTGGKKNRTISVLLGTAAVLFVLLAVMVSILIINGRTGVTDPNPDTLQSTADFRPEPGTTGMTGDEQSTKETQEGIGPGQETVAQQGSESTGDATPPKEDNPPKTTNPPRDNEPTKATNPPRDNEPTKATNPPGENDTPETTDPPATDSPEEPTYSNADVVNAYIDERGHLILVLKDGTKIDKGPAEDNTQTEPEATYLVVFEDHDGSTLKTETVKAGGSATPPEVPSREGYTFAGWSGSYTNVQDNVTVVAQYRQNEPAVETFTVIFTDGMGNVLKTQVVEKGKPAEAPAEPVREGYRFTGWDKAFDRIISDLTVNARFEQLPDTDPAIYVQNVTANAGESIQVAIRVRNNPGIAGARLFVYYDEKLTLTAAAKGEAFSVLDYTAPAVLSSGCAFNWDSLDAQATADGAVLLLTFQVPADAASGDTFRVELSFRQGDIYDVDLNNVEIALTAGTITVEG